MTPRCSSTSPAAIRRTYLRNDFNVQGVRLRTFQPAREEITATVAVAGALSGRLLPCSARDCCAVAKAAKR
jgi:hypothetical protein